MLLSDTDILRAVDAGDIRLDPFDEKLVQPSSVDVRLGPDYSVMEPDLDYDNYSAVFVNRIPENLFTRHRIAGWGLNLRPGEFVLCSTLEVLTLSDRFAAVLEGKSTLGRLGLQIHATAGFIDPGFSGQVTLEMSNIGKHPIQLNKGDLVGQLCFMPMSTPVAKPYGHPDLRSRYQNQRGATPPSSA